MSQTGAAGAAIGAAAEMHDFGDGPEHLYTAAHVANITAHSWNVFRYIGDYMHLFGVIALLVVLAKNRGCQGISRSTQILYFFVFCTRYLDLLDHSQTAYLVFFKLTYIITSLIAVVLFWAWDKTYERQKDTCSLTVIFVPCVTAAVLLANDYSALEMLWSFSQFLEGFAMVPQYIFCYRDRGSADIGVTMYVLSLGGYRVFYAANWIYKKVHLPHYSDIQSWTGGLWHGTFFLDYVISRVTGYSLLRSLVLKLDEKINDFQAGIEFKVLGSSRGSRAGEADGEGECELRHRRGKGDEAPQEV